MAGDGSRRIGRRQFVQAGAVAGAALLGRPGGVVAEEAASGGLTAEEIVKLLDLQPNATCGFVRVTFTSPLAIAPGGLPAPFADGRPLGSALYFLVTPTAPVRPASHPERPALPLLSRRSARGVHAPR